MDSLELESALVEKVLLKTESVQRCIEAHNYFIREGILQQEKLRREMLAASKKRS